METRKERTQEEYKEFDCLDCPDNTFFTNEYYMVQFDLWLQANPQDHGMLCIRCLENRLGRELKPADFIVCPVNEGCFPQSDRLYYKINGRSKPHTLIYPLLYLEKLAQEIIKLINKERRDRGFQVGDSVDVLLDATEEYRLAVYHNSEMIERNAKCVLMTYPSDKLSIVTIKAQ